ncbi:hypothetical protein LSCM4_08225 [Leishmania orientalis]|uniref:Rubicon Homology domain-containing protein n=1 Tax=Leishmania orientalis TaxID=2249476 RepID=A0A836KUZ1_9TRYP|nr:hypothetical protein LSCM4_08225 [Leishmania orientalis]
MREGAGGQNCGAGSGGYGGHAADADAAHSHPPSMANVRRALQYIVAELQQQQRQAVPSNAGVEADRASAEENTSAHLEPPALRASISSTDGMFSTPLNTAKPECERRRLLFLAEWAQRVAEVYAPIMPSAAQAAAASLQSACTTSHDALTDDKAERAAATPPSLTTNTHRRVIGTAVATAVADSPLSEEATTPISCADEDLTPVRYASVPVERRLSYPGVYSNAYDVTSAPVSATPESHRALPASPGSEATSRAHVPLPPHTAMAAPAAASSFSSPPSPLIPRGRAPLCRVVGAAFGVPTTRPAQRAVLAAQGGCCARCGVVLPPPLFRSSGWCSALTRRLHARLGRLSCCFQRCRGGGDDGQATVSPSCRRTPWYACMGVPRRSPSEREEEDTRSAAIAAVHATREAISDNGGGPRDARSNSRARRGPRDRDRLRAEDGAAGDDGSDEGGSAASEQDPLLSGGTRTDWDRCARAAHHHCSSVSSISGAAAPRSAAHPPGSAHASSGLRCSDGTGDWGGSTSGDAPVFFCTYEGHYLCLRCFHTPLNVAGLGAAMSVASAAATSALGGTFVPEDYQTRDMALVEWQARGALTTPLFSSSAQPRSLWRGHGGGEDAEESPARAVLRRESEQSHEWWLARHVAQPTPAPSSLSATGSRAVSGLDHPPLHLCVLPAHVLHRWDFTRFPVSAAAAAALHDQCYSDSASNRESGLSSRESRLERGEQCTTADGGDGVASRGNDEGRQTVLRREEQGARGQPSAPASPSPPALGHVPNRSRGSDGTSSAMEQLPALYDVSAINPSLYKRVPALASASRLRQRMSLLHARAWWCPRYRHEVWGLQSGDEWAGEATVFSVVQQPPLPRSTTAHAVGSPPRPASMAEGATDSGEAHLLTQEASSPSPSPPASRPLSVGTSQASPHAARLGQTGRNLSGGAVGTSSPPQDSPAAAEASVPLQPPTPARVGARRRYLVEGAEGWSLHDLYRLTIPSSPSSAGAPTTSSPPLLLAELQSIFSIMQAHVSGCSHCAAQCRGMARRAPLGEGRAGVS